MSAGRKLLAGAAQLAMGHGAAQLLGLARNFLVARLLGPEDFGVAATFAATIAIVEATTDVGLDKYLVLTRRGDEPALQRTIHGLMATRGLLTALAVFLLAEPIARLFDAPETAGGFRWLALAPLLRGFAHTDVKRLQRGLSFRREAMIMASAQFAALVVAVGLAFALRSWWAMLWGVLAHAAMQMAMTQRLAERPYRLGFERAELRAALAFGWPLTLNSLIIVLAAQGDRVVVGAALGMAELGVYAAATSILSATVSFIQQVSGTTLLPWMTHSNDERLSRQARADLIFLFFTILSIIFMVFFKLYLNYLIDFIFGSSFILSISTNSFIVLLFGSRLFRSWQTLLALSSEKTTKIVVINLTRFLFFSVGFFIYPSIISINDLLILLLYSELLSILIISTTVIGHDWVSKSWRYFAPSVVALALFVAIAELSAP